MTPQKHSAKFLRRLFTEFDGRLYWNSRPESDFKCRQAFLSWNAKYPGEEAGSLRFTTKRKDGIRDTRWVIGINNVNYHRSRIMWCLHHDEWPEIVDHADLDTMNDRIGNLRPCGHSKNKANTPKRSCNTSGYKGIVWNKKNRRWQARVTVNGKQIHGGCFATREEAHAAYVETAAKHFGEFARAE